MIPKISIIVPVYNVEQYISDCLESIVSQNTNEIEALLIDDGSTDNSLAICREYAAKFENIKVFHQENKGLGYTRNRGVDLARGEYLAFLDSDDYVPSDIYHKLYLVAKKTNADIILGKAMRFDSTSRKLYTPYATDRVFEKEELFVVSPSTIPYVIHNGIVANKLYKRKFVQDNNLRFLEGVHYEDTYFSLAAYNAANRMAILPVVTYFWRMRELGDLSISQQVYSLKNLRDRIYVNNTCDSEINLKKEFTEEWTFFKYNNLINSFVTDITKVNTDEIEKYKELIHLYLSSMPETLLERMSLQSQKKYIFAVEKRYDLLKAIETKAYENLSVKYRNGRFLLVEPGISNKYRGLLDLSHDFVNSTINNMKIYKQSIKIDLTVYLRNEWIANKNVEITFFLKNKTTPSLEILLSVNKYDFHNNYRTILCKLNLDKVIKNMKVPGEKWELGLRVKYRDLSQDVMLKKIKSNDLLIKNLLGTIVFRSNKNGNFYLHIKRDMNFIDLIKRKGGDYWRKIISSRLIK